MNIKQNKRNRETDKLYNVQIVQYSQNPPKVYSSSQCSVLSAQAAFPFCTAMLSLCYRTAFFRISAGGYRQLILGSHEQWLRRRQDPGLDGDRHKVVVGRQSLVFVCLELLSGIGHLSWTSDAYSEGVGKSHNNARHCPRPRHRH